MAVTDIQISVQSVTGYFLENPEKAISQDKPATAVLEEGLCCRVAYDDQTVIFTDMSKSLGGGASGPSGGWLSRAALATCLATTIALRAAQMSVELTTLKVTVKSISDDRGLLGMDDSISAGMLHVDICVQIGAEGAAAGQLKEIIAWAEAHSPVIDTVRRPVPIALDVEVV